jgi:ribonuclease HI
LSEPKEVTIYTRGVSLSSGLGGYAVVLIYNGRRKELVGGSPASSNNRMDIQAAIEGLKALKQPCSVTLYNNNTYLIDAIVKGWAVKWRARGWTKGERKPTPHADLWEELLTLCSVHEVSFIYCKRDSHDHELTRCDVLAHEAARSIAQVREPT